MPLCYSEGVLNSIIDKLPDEIHIPGYQFCGPGCTQYDVTYHVMHVTYNVMHATYDVMHDVTYDVTHLYKCPGIGATEIILDCSI
ncbi:hypothetical protein NQ315_003627 [Exocentrus adspersus]|uniref:Uncharacterized protein n=1 Tax=Exocentrus adspersus TaxID=1586481 RepID=A0AAV8VJE4_9CUCU|nr:hypothetical protein NQ315_003627 [Exocentrus adspersus]